MIHHQIKLQTLASPLHSMNSGGQSTYTRYCRHIDPIQVSSSIESIRPVNVAFSPPSYCHFDGIPQLIFKLMLNFGQIPGWCVLYVCVCGTIHSNQILTNRIWNIWCQCRCYCDDTIGYDLRVHYQKAFQV